MATHILIIDNDPMLCEPLRQALEAEGYVAHLAADAEEALAAALTHPPSLAVLNLSLPAPGGLDLCRRLWLEHPDLSIVPLVDPASPGREVVMKPAPPRRLLARVRAVLRRGDTAAATVLEFGDLRLDPATRDAWRGERPINLTATEHDLLRLFLQNPRQVLTRDFLYERVWGHDFEGESKVLEIYIHYLRRKLEAGGEPRLLMTVRGAGYVLREAE